MNHFEIIGQFEVFKYKAQESLCLWLNRELPQLSEINWWQSCVLENFSHQQRQTMQNIDVNNLSSLDFAQLLNVLDSNWNNLRRLHRFSNENRNYVKELQNARNRWSHKTTNEIRQNPNGINFDDLYRDIDTIWRFMGLFNTTEQKTLEEIQEFKRSFLNPRPQQAQQQPRPEPDDLKNNEILRVRNRVPRWARNQQQINAKILTLFLKLEREGFNEITQQMLMENYGNQLEFKANFRQMKDFGANNHGKVFDVDENGIIKIWEPIRIFIEEYKRIIFQTT